MNAVELNKALNWTWQQKVDHSLAVIDNFLSSTNNMAFVSFSGGKDSSVLLDIVRILKKDVKAVFFNTGMEYPSIVKHVRSMMQQGYNIDFINPSVKAKEIWAHYGFPLVSKEQAHKLYYMKNAPTCKTALTGFSENSMQNVSHCWRFLVDEQFCCSDLCCRLLKKRPSHAYEKKTGLHPIIGTMVSESLLRREQYLRRGNCNSFAKGKVFSTPLSIWTDKDVWAYIQDRKIIIPDLYYNGVRRTGCVMCGFGAHLEQFRFDYLYNNHPKMYESVMAYENNGVTYRNALRKVLAVTSTELPDERKQLYFNFHFKL